MVQQADIEQRQGLLETGRERTIRGRRLRRTRGMLMSEDDGRCIELQGTLCDDTRMHFAAIDGAGEQVFSCQQPVAGVKEQHAEDFVGLMRQSHLEDAGGCGRIGELLTALEAPGQDLLGGAKDFVFGRCGSQTILTEDVLRAAYLTSPIAPQRRSWEPISEADEARVHRKAATEVEEPTGLAHGTGRAKVS